MLFLIPSVQQHAFNKIQTKKKELNLKQQKVAKQEELEEPQCKTNHVLNTQESDVCSSNYNVLTYCPATTSDI